MQNETDEAGKVIAVDGDFVTVRMKRSEACARCGACRGLSETEMVVQARNDCGAVIGDYVRVTLMPGVFLKAILILYAIPLAALLAGLFAGAYFGKMAGLDNFSPLLGFTGGFTLMCLAYLGIKKREPVRSKKGNIPVAAEIVSIS